MNQKSLFFKLFMTLFFFIFTFFLQSYGFDFIQNMYQGAKEKASFILNKGKEKGSQIIDSGKEILKETQKTAEDWVSLGKEKTKDFFNWVTGKKEKSITHQAENNSKESKVVIPKRREEQQIKIDEKKQQNREESSSLKIELSDQEKEIINETKKKMTKMLKDIHQDKNLSDQEKIIKAKKYIKEFADSSEAMAMKSIFKTKIVSSDNYSDQEESKLKTLMNNFVMKSLKKQVVFGVASKKKRAQKSSSTNKKPEEVSTQKEEVDESVVESNLQEKKNESFDQEGIDSKKVTVINKSEKEVIEDEAKNIINSVLVQPSSKNTLKLKNEDSQKNDRSEVLNEEDIDEENDEDEENDKKIDIVEKEEKALLKKIVLPKDEEESNEEQK